MPITGIGAVLHHTAAELYQQHCDKGDGTCVTCHRPAPCGTRRHAEYVIVEAGEDPRTYPQTEQ